MAAPVLAMTGREDIATPPEVLQHISFWTRAGVLTALEDAAHLAPAKVPEQIIELIPEHADRGAYPKELQP